MLFTVLYLFTIIFCFTKQKHGSSGHRKSSSPSTHGHGHSHSHSSMHTNNENPLLPGSDRVLQLLPGEIVLDVQYQNQLLPSLDIPHTQDIDSSTNSTGDNSFSFSSVRPLSADTIQNKKFWTSGIGILTSLRVLILIVQETSSSSTLTSSMRLCNSHTHTDSPHSTTRTSVHTSKSHKGMTVI